MIIKAHNLEPLIYDSHIYYKITDGICSLPHATCLAREKLKKLLINNGYV